MARPIVGITVSIDPGVRIRPGQDTLYVGRAYARAVDACGGAPILLPPDLAPERAATLCAGLVLTGGAMLPAALNGAPPGALTPGPAEEAERVAWDLALIDAARTRRKPLLGVCYGMQLLNLRLGGTLYEDLRSVIDTAVDHGGSSRVVAHELVIDRETILGASLGERTRVASSHHQAVSRLALGLRATAHAEDGVIEAFEGEGLLGVEWHPELDATSRAVYGWLVEEARKGA
ncbi:gamma-glutamyl-gamma-aminobutyrate hydrolase family protein [Myxococcota bacterium]|nr:gamma-glutamyl-gamma-aminobutyrate hydrolase family protein [Myxococcota bacterium]MCZ7616972.1 gamma-glutamyl-gamma-aminobutyrate hydrolase family protein [Myxococcota bacterium]